MKSQIPEQDGNRHCGSDHNQIRILHLNYHGNCYDNGEQHYGPDLLSAQVPVVEDDQKQQDDFIEEGSDVVKHVVGAVLENRQTVDDIEVEEHFSKRVQNLKQHEGHGRNHYQEDSWILLVCDSRGNQNVNARQTGDGDLQKIEAAVYQVIQPQRDLNHMHDGKTAEDIGCKASHGAEKNQCEDEVCSCGEFLCRYELEGDGYQEQKRTELVL